MAQKKIIQQALEIMGERLVEVLQAQIITEGLFKTGNLANSVTHVVTDDKLSITMNDYGIYQDSGVYGSNSTKNQVVASPKSLFTPGQFKSKVIGGPLPFPVRYSIAQKGLKPRPFILPAYENNRTYLEEPLINGIEDQITVNVFDIGKKHGAKLV